MEEQSLFYLIVGLGNPGNAYKATRHNIGFQIVEALAKKRSWEFKEAPSFQGKIALGVVKEKKVILLKPQTYMNSSGESVRLCSSYYRVPNLQIVVVSDDIYLPLGKLRIKTSGGSGGHNGLKSVESHLGTQVYGKLKVGVGQGENGDLADYVLSPFLEVEKEKVSSSIERAVMALERWLELGVVSAMECANREENRSDENI